MMRHADASADASADVDALVSELQATREILACAHEKIQQLVSHVHALESQAKKKEAAEKARAEKAKAEKAKAEEKARAEGGRRASVADRAQGRECESLAVKTLGWGRGGGGGPLSPRSPEPGNSRGRSGSGDSAGGGGSGGGGGSSGASSSGGAAGARKSWRKPRSFNLSFGGLNFNLNSRSLARADERLTPAQALAATPQFQALRECELAQLLACLSPEQAFADGDVIVRQVLESRRANGPLNGSLAALSSGFLTAL
jgi:hypothetical protein